MSFGFCVSGFELQKYLIPRNPKRETRNSSRPETSSESEVNDGTRNGNDFIS